MDQRVHLAALNGGRSRDLGLPSTHSQGNSSMNLWIRIGVPIGVSMLVFAYVTRLIMRGSSLMHRRLISEMFATASQRHSGEIAESTEHCCDIPALPTTLRLSPRSPRLTLTAQGFTFGGI